MLYVPVSPSPVFEGGNTPPHPGRGNLRQTAWSGDSLLYFPGGVLIFSLTHWSVDFQVEHQYSHKFTVTVKQAKNVTKGALGDMRKYLYHLITIFFFFFYFYFVFALL